MPKLKTTLKCLTILLLINLSFFAQESFILGVKSTAPVKPPVGKLAMNFNLKKVGQYSGAWEVVDVFIKDSIAFLADQEKGLVVVNISDVTNPSFLSQFQDNGNSVYDVIVEGNVAYVAHGRAGLKILDISNITSLQEVGHYNNGGVAWKIFLMKPYLFLVDKLEGIEILDISDKTAPKQIGLYAGQPFDVFVRGDFAYVAAGINKGLEIVDISDPTKPKKIGETSVNFEDSVSVSVKDDYAYVAFKSNGLRIIKISRARHPKVVATFDDMGEGKIWGIEIKENLAYLACEAQGIQILDITNPLAIYKVGEYSEYPHGKTFNVKSENPFLFMANFELGLEILQWKTAPPNPVESPYHQIDSAILNFNNSVGPFAINAVLGNETLGLNLSLFLDVGLMSPVNITAEAPQRINPGDKTNLRIGITAETSYFWGHFEGTIKFTTPLGSSELFSLEEVGIPKFVKLQAFKTFIGENIVTDSLVYPLTLWSQNFMNYSLSLVMSSYFNVTGSSIVTGEINNSATNFELEWGQDREQLIIPLKVPENLENAYIIPLKNLRFEIDDLALDLYYIRFDVMVSNLIPIYSWEINISNFNLLPKEHYSLNAATSFFSRQRTNNTLLYLDGIYPLGTFIIVLNFSGNLNLPPWAVFLTLFGIIAMIIIPWSIIFLLSRRKQRRQRQFASTTENE
ncbi:MAG: hypothetical protein K9W42_02370 [Candidatus Heimdallarchaeota archaeon]|nr:hypothetical protein [Candidatus Heimdallarchaeota archaeon]